MCPKKNNLEAGDTIDSNTAAGKVKRGTRKVIENLQDVPNKINPQSLNVPETSEALVISGKALLGKRIVSVLSGERVEGIINDLEVYGPEEIDAAAYKGARAKGQMTEAGTFDLVWAQVGYIVLISHGSKDSAACIKINKVQGLAEKPTKVAKALGIDKNNKDQVKGAMIDGGYIYVEDIGVQITEDNIEQCERRGVTSGRELPWRFRLKNKVNS